jgi:hypothetical protein
MGALNALETDLETTSSEAGWGHATPARGAGSSFWAGSAGSRKGKSVRTKRVSLTNSQRALATQSRRRAAGQCVVCGDDAVNKNHCERHRKLCAARERNKYRRMHGIPVRAKLRSVRQPRPRAEGMSAEDSAVLASMWRNGGRFTRSLARAGMNADAEDLRRLKTAWPEHWEKYRGLAKSLAKKEQQTALTDPNGVSGSAIANIYGNGHDVRNDANLPANKWLEGRTYALANGGHLISNQ